jgi:hypothetical protein
VGGGDVGVGFGDGGVGLDHEVLTLVDAGVEVAEVASGEARGGAAASVGFDVAAYSVFHFGLLGYPLPPWGDFVGMFMVLLGLRGIDLCKILI